MLTKSFLSQYKVAVKPISKLTVIHQYLKKNSETIKKLQEENKELMMMKDKIKYEAAKDLILSSGLELKDIQNVMDKLRE